MSVQVLALRDGIAGWSMLGKHFFFFFFSIPHTAVWTIYPAGIPSGPSGCDILYLLLRSIPACWKDSPTVGTL